MFVSKPKHGTINPVFRGVCRKDPIMMKLLITVFIIGYLVDHTDCMDDDDDWNSDYLIQWSDNDDYLSFSNFWESIFDQWSDNDDYFSFSNFWESISDQWSVINVCDSNPCVNGVCFSTSSYSQYNCVCSSGWTGTNCNTSISVVSACYSNPCVNGVCISTTSSSSSKYTCECSSGWTGTNCNIEITACDSNPCINGNCLLDSSSDAYQYHCTCYDGYTGDICDEVETACDNNPCQNGECLIVPTDNTYFCHCDEGWMGQHCEEQVNLELECLSNPCLHGECLELSGEGYFCSCEDNWTGLNCQTSTIGCVAVPCLNGGVCRDVGSNGDYECDCPEGFDGQDCHTVESSCDPDPCINGECLDIQSSMTFYCLCDESWTGTLCDTVGSDHTNSIETTSNIISLQTTEPAASPDHQTSSDLPIGIIAGVVGAAVVIIIVLIIVVCLIRNNHSLPKPGLNGVENQTYELDDSKPPLNDHTYDNPIHKEYATEVKSKPTGGETSNEYMEPISDLYADLQESTYAEIPADQYMELNLNPDLA